MSKQLSSLKSMLVGRHDVVNRQLILCRQKHYAATCLGFSHEEAILSAEEDALVNERLFLEQALDFAEAAEE